MSTAENSEFVSAEDYLAAEEQALTKKRIHRRLGSACPMGCSIGC